MTPVSARVTAWVEEAREEIARWLLYRDENDWDSADEEVRDFYRADADDFLGEPFPARLLAVVRGVAELAEEHRRWAVINRDLAERVGVTERDFHIGMAQAQESSVRHLRKLLADAAPDTENETDR